MKKRYDVIVVGARVAGASTAMLLARSGLDVALIDRSSYGSDTLSTHALMRAGVLQLSRWGVLDDVVAAGTPPVERTMFHFSDTDSVQVSIRRSPGVEALYAPRRFVLDRILVDAASDGGVDVHHGVTVTGLLQSTDGRVVGVRTKSAGGAEASVRSRIVIGADGIRSTVADAVGAPVERRGSWAGAALYRYYADFCVAGYEWAYGPGAAAGMIPTNEGLTCVFAFTTPHRLRELRRGGADVAFDTVFGEAAPDHLARMRTASPASRLHGWGGIRGFVRRSFGPGWALVGDAGHFKDPITAHGMTDALRDAELLANAVTEALSGLRAETAAFAEYQTMRERLSARFFDATDRISAYDWEMDEVRRLLRGVSSAMTDEVETLESLPFRVEGAAFTGLIPPDRTRVRE